MTAKHTPAILGGSPVVAPEQEPRWAVPGPIESAALAEVTELGEWYAFQHVPGKWRAILEQVVADTIGYRYGVGQPNGTLAIGSGLRAQLLERGDAWAAGRDEVLVADLTHASAHHGVLVGLAPQLGRVPKLIPIDAKLDATMNEEIVADYLDRHAERVLGIVPATMYGNFGAIERIVELGERHDVLVHHDNALGGAARYDGRKAPTCSISGQASGKAAPGGEAGLTLSLDPQLARWLRADTDTGHGPGRLDPIPYAEQSVIAAGNQRLGEHPAALMVIQWLRALHGRLQIRENRRLVQELLADTTVLPAPVLWNPPTDAEYPPFFALYLLCTDALEAELGLAPRDLHAAFAAEGIGCWSGFTPTHQDPAWRHVTEGLDLPYAGSARVFERTIFIEPKWLREPRFPEWLREILERIVAHKDALHGIGERSAS